jgi:hypothetical protein
MPILSEPRARAIADLIEAYDETIATANVSKHETWDAAASRKHTKKE